MRSSVLRLLVPLLLATDVAAFEKLAYLGSVTQGVHHILESEVNSNDWNAFHTYSSCTSNYAMSGLSLIFKGAVEWNRSMLKDLLGDLGNQGQMPDVARLSVILEGLEVGNDYLTGPIDIRNLNAKLYTESCSTPLGAATAASVDSVGVNLNHFSSTYGNVSGVKTYDFLLDYDDYSSLRMNFNGVDMCCEMIPSLPQLPEMYSALIEANFEKEGEGSYTMLRKEFYLPQFGRERIEEHADSKSTVTIKEFSSNKKYVITHTDVETGEDAPSGLCYEHHLTKEEMAYETVNHHLQSVEARMSFNHNSAHTMFLGNGNGSFVGMPREQYLGKDFYVRGIKSEAWSHDFQLPDWSNRNAVNSYTLRHFFPVEDWSTASRHVHRMLKRVTLNGTHWDGKKVKHTYEYIDMTPYIFDADRVFNPCTVLDFTFQGNCSCSARELRMLVKDLGDTQLHKTNHHYTMEDVCGFYGIHLDNSQKGAIAGTAIALWIVGLAMGIGIMHMRKRWAIKRQQSHLQFKNQLSADHEMVSVDRDHDPWGDPAQPPDQA